ncbi:MAG TPA: pseudouridine-5'-phosphate glycosidase [Gemmatimonadaceae bacterium]
MNRAAVRLSPEVDAARRSGRPVVALESSVFAQGLPSPYNVQAFERMLAAIEAAGAVAAVTAVVDGEPCAGLTSAEVRRLMDQPGVLKASARDLPVVMASATTAATTVAASLALCRWAGLEVFATGGIGGVHREPAYDESADLVELGRTPAVVVCAGAKTILDLPATMERLESLSVSVVGYRTDEVPGFFVARTGLRVGATVTSAEEVARIYRAQRKLGLPGALLVLQAPPEGESLDAQELEAVIESALDEARVRRVTGSGMTPFLLDAVRRLTNGRSLRTNLALLEANARLAAEIARAVTISDS